ncbi:MAG: hypothetical protein U0L20_02640 [Ruminococcus sp.]|nr:hypothetical protein [Ruminococcus sp.]
MSDRTIHIAEMIEMLPYNDKDLAYELIKKLVLAWDPDYTKLTPGERKRLEEVEADPEFVRMDDIDWD